MKHLMVVLSIAIAFIACKSSKAQTQQEQYFAREISQDSAALLIKYYEEDKGFKNAFGRGMFIPVKVIDALREEGLSGFSIYYGKHPSFITPVFLIHATKEAFQYKPSPVNTPPTRTYIVYYPCPTQCG